MDAIRIAGPLPQFLSDMRRNGRQHQQKLLNALPPGRRVNAALGPHLAQMIRQFHQSGDSRVELELVQIVVALADRLMQNPQGIPYRLPVGGRRRQVLRIPLHKHPHPVKPPRHPVNPHIAPRPALVPRANEHQETAHRVGPHQSHHIIRVDHIAPALAHLFVVRPQNHPLVEQAQKGLVKIHQPHIPHCLDEKAGIEQMQHGVFRSPGVLVHRQPLFQQLRVERAAIILGADIAQQIPGRIDKSVHRIRFPPRRPAALRTVHIEKRRMTGQRRLAGRLELRILRQQHRQIPFGNRHNAAPVAVNHRNRRPPIPLPGNQPVPQPVRSRPPATAVLFNIVGNSRLAFLVGHPVILAGIGHKAFAQVRRRRFPSVPLQRRNHRAYRQTVFPGKSQIPVIVGRHPHHRAGAVGSQHIVGSENRNPLPVQPVDSVGTQGNPGLFLVRGHPLNFRSPPGLADILLHRRPLPLGSQRRHQGMLGSQYQESYAKDGVNAGSKGSDFVNAYLIMGNVKADLNALAAPHPVALHHQDFLRPVH